MTSNILRVLMLGAAFALLGSGIASAETPATPNAVAQATPAPKTTPNPLGRFNYSGYVRSYYFTRTNGFPGWQKKANQASFNTAFDLHLGYDFGGGLSAGATYLYASPFNSTCDSAASHLSLPCAGHGVHNPPQNNPDDTLPGYNLNTLYEAYLQYKNSNAFVRLGDQVINTPWANSSDSRLKPVAFQGGDASYKIDNNWSVEGMYMSRWEDRVQSNFTNTTLLTVGTAAYPDAPGVSNTGLGKYGYFTNNGFYMGRVGYTDKAFGANLYYYGFQNIANAIWGDAKFGLAGSMKPFIALQGGTQSNTGSALAGKISSEVLGVEGGISPWKHVDLTVGADYIPVKSETITLPAGASCSTSFGSANQIVGNLNYFLPTGGTPNCVPGTTAGTATVYYGGWASPYTDSYATDPLFDTSMTQGMADRRSPGGGVKVAATINQDNKKIRFILSRAWYRYGNSTVGVSPTQETDLDGTYFFNKVGKGAYHGLLLRQRWGDRTEQFAAPFGGVPEFVYSRTQLEYDF